MPGAGTGGKSPQILDSSSFCQRALGFLDHPGIAGIQMANSVFFFFFGALEISVYVINRNIPAGDCNVIIKYSPGCWVY